MKAEESEAARDKELELLRKKSQEQDEKLAHLMALFGAKVVWWLCCEPLCLWAKVVVAFWTYELS